jgi:hypothetical protein
MLDAPELKTLASNKLETYLSSNWVAQEFPKVVIAVYSTTNKSDLNIRNMILLATKTHFKELMEMDDFREVLYEFADYSGSLVVGGTTAPPAKAVAYKCLSCACVIRHSCGNCGHFHY